VLAVVFMAWLANDIRNVMWIAVVPAFIAVALFILLVHEPEHGAVAPGKQAKLRLVDARRLQLRYWLVVMLGTVFNLARFSEAFLVLRAQDVGLALGYVPLVMIIMNVFYAALAFPAGAAADRLSPRALLFSGLVLLIAADVCLAGGTTPLMTFIGAALWGLHLALTQGLLSKLVADTSPVELRGTAFGLFNLVTGVALLLASLIAGALWSAYGASVTFLVGGGFAALAALGVVVYPTKPQPAT
jgi:MFS family permease